MRYQGWELERMFVITADQIDSTNRPDAAGSALETLNANHGDRLVLPVDRTAGDEIQALVADAETALAIITELARSETWSVGCGIGDVRTPLPAAAREATGSAFVAARHAVGRAKRAPLRFALAIDESRLLSTEDVAPLIELLLFMRSRRTPEGWETFDLLSTGMTGADAATALAISPQAVSQRARAAGVRTELAARTALIRLLEEADRPKDADADDGGGTENGR